MHKLLLLAACLGLACGPTERKVPTTNLGKPVDTLVVPYSFISNAAWLGGNRWAFVAPNERRAVAVDFDRDSTAALGAPKPPYQDPFLLFRAADSLYVADWGARNMTVWTVDGRLIRSLPATLFVRGAFPEAKDGQGRFYAKLTPPPGPDGSGNRDSVAIISMTADLRSVDTVAHLAPADIAEVFGDAGRRFEARALSGSDQWGVLPDGTIWIARVNQNRVDRRGPDGKWSRGEQLPDRVLQVLPEDRDIFLKQFPEELRSTAQKVPFAIIKPPFESAFADPEGNVWLMKSYSLEDSTRSAQVVDPSGRLLKQLEFRGYGRVVGANQQVAVVAESDSTTHRLLVYRIPPIVAEKR